MPTNISPKDLNEQVHRGIDRTHNFRKARMMYLRQMVGQYYDKDSGSIGTEPINLIYNAIRTIVPNLVMNFPKFNVESEWVAYRDYGELLGMGLDYDTKQKDLRDTYRRWIVDALFMLGTLKTGVGDSGTALSFDDWGESYDPGMVYTELVDFDDLIIDPACTDFRKAAFIGDRIRVPRESLLESGLYDNELIEQLPNADEEASQSKRDARHLSQQENKAAEVSEFMDEVEVAELWVPSAEAIVTVPATKDVTFDRYLRVADFYGPSTPTGPYTFLQFGVPVPNNPINAAAVGIWYDLHILANKMAKKTIDQATRQKTIVGFRRQAADDAQEALDAMDGEAIAMDDPDGIKEYNFGGQMPSNENMTSQLTGWFNMMAANPQGLSGSAMDADSATEAQILQGNANIGLNDMKDAVYIAVAEEGAKRAWYFHTDPLIELPIAKRQPIPPVIDPTTGAMIQPARIEDVQEFLTPEARQGDWVDFTFAVQPESMGRVDSQVRLRQALDFAAKVIPSVATAAQAMAMMGQPFSISKFLIRLAKDAGIDWLDEVFYDPEFQMQMAQMMMQAPGPEGSQAQVAPGGGGTGPGGLGAAVQNGQPANVPAMPTAQQEQRQGQQAMAAEGQRDQGVRPLS
jgi:hypothetical protein